MNDIFDELIESYDTSDKDKRDQIIREVIQELIIYGLSQAGFFKKAAFVGGTSLRLFHGPDRFSEDLDFMLMGPVAFDINDYFPILEERLSAFGVKFNAKEKKREGSKIAAGEVSALSKELYLSFFSEDDFSKGIYKTQLTKIKMEIDTDPAERATYERIMKVKPFIHEVTICDKETLFAGKMHAILFRNWGKRVKGRDLYDFLFYASEGTPFNIDFLNEKIKKSGYSDRDLTFEEISNMLRKRFSEIDYNSARRDVMPYVDTVTKEEVKKWCPELFIQMAGSLKCGGNFTFLGECLDDGSLAQPKIMKDRRGRKKRVVS